MRSQFELLLIWLLWKIELFYHLTQWEEFQLMPPMVKLQKWSRFEERQRVKRRVHQRCEAYLAYRSFRRTGHLAR